MCGPLMDQERTGVKPAGFWQYRSQYLVYFNLCTWHVCYTLTQEYVLHNTHLISIKSIDRFVQDPESC